MAATAQPSPFKDAAGSVHVPALRHTAVTPHATEFLDTPIRRLWVGTGGNLTLVDSEGNAAEYKNIPGGSWVGDFACITAVRPGSGTAAADLVGLV